MVVVFIDTNVFKKEHYQFDSGDFEELSQYINLGHVTLLLTPVLIAELKYHYNEDIIKKYMNSIDGLARNLKKYNIPIVATLTENEIKGKLEEPLNKFLLNPKHTHKDLAALDINLILEDYCNNNPPFTSSKRDEFKDAINIQLIKHFHSNTHNTVYIVGDDCSFNEAFQNSDPQSFKLFKTLNDLNVTLRPLITDLQYLEEYLNGYIEETEFKIFLDDNLKDIKKYSKMSGIIEVKSIQDIDIKKSTFAITKISEGNCDGVINVEGTLSLVYLRPVELSLGLDVKDVYKRENVSFRGNIPYAITYKHELGDGDQQYISVNCIELNWNNFIVETPIDFLFNFYSKIQEYSTSLFEDTTSNM